MCTLYENLVVYRMNVSTRRFGSPLYKLFLENYNSSRSIDETHRVPGREVKMEEGK